VSSSPEPSRGEVVVYEAPDGEVRVDVRLERETVWLTQQQMAELFGRERSVVTKHIRNAFKEGELDPLATSARSAQVRTEGNRTISREVDHYSLDVILTVGYRVNSKRGTQFRIWATRTLRRHLLDGFTLNERRLTHLRQFVSGGCVLTRTYDGAGSCWHYTSPAAAGLGGPGAGPRWVTGDGGRRPAAAKA
jgi:hypothetical protein